MPRLKRLVLIRVLYCFLTVMAAELVSAARSEDGEPERLRLGEFYIFWKRKKNQIRH